MLLYIAKWRGTSGRGSESQSKEPSYRFADESLEGHVRGLLSRFLPDHYGSVLPLVYPFLAATLAIIRNR